MEIEKIRERNQLIVECIKKGESKKYLANKYNLTSTRITQIYDGYIKEEKEANKREQDMLFEILEKDINSYKAMRRKNINSLNELLELYSYDINEVKKLQYVSTEIKEYVLKCLEKLTPIDNKITVQVLENLNSDIVTDKLHNLCKKSIDTYINNNKPMNVVTRNSIELNVIGKISKIDLDKHEAEIILKHPSLFKDNPIIGIRPLFKLNSKWTEAKFLYATVVFK